MIIGLGGEKQVGKDTTANYLIEKHSFEKMSFATPIRSICSNVYPYDFYNDALKDEPFEVSVKLTDKDLRRLVSQIDDTIFETETWSQIQSAGKNVLFNSIRDILKFVGTDLGRTFFGTNIWVNWAQKLIKESDDAVLSDMRFANERAALKELGGVLVRIKRATGLLDAHVSENSLGDDSEYDYIIENNGNLADLYNSINLIIRENNEQNFRHH